MTLKTSLRRLTLALGLLAAGSLMSTAPTRAAGPEDFQIDDARDLVQLCAAKPDTELYVASIHMCQGYAVGVYQYATLLFDQTGASLVCLPDPAPTRNQAIADFVSWMQANPGYMGVKAPEALLRFLTTAYPCS